MTQWLCCWLVINNIISITLSFLNTGKTIYLTWKIIYLFTIAIFVPYTHYNGIWTRFCANEKWTVWETFLPTPSTPIKLEANTTGDWKSLSIDLWYSEWGFHNKFSPSEHFSFVTNYKIEQIFDSTDENLYDTFMDIEDKWKCWKCTISQL